MNFLIISLILSAIIGSQEHITIKGTVQFVDADNDQLPLAFLPLPTFICLKYSDDQGNLQRCTQDLPIFPVLYNFQYEVYLPKAYAQYELFPALTLDPLLEGLGFQTLESNAFKIPQEGDSHFGTDARVLVPELSQEQRVAFFIDGQNYLTEGIAAATIFSGSSFLAGRSFIYCLNPVLQDEVEKKKFGLFFMILAASGNDIEFTAQAANYLEERGYQKDVWYLFGLKRLDKLRTDDRTRFKMIMRKANAGKALMNSKDIDTEQRTLLGSRVVDTYAQALQIYPKNEDAFNLATQVVRDQGYREMGRNLPDDRLIMNTLEQDENLLKSYASVVSIKLYEVPTAELPFEVDSSEFYSNISRYFERIDDPQIKLDSQQAIALSKKQQ